MNEYETLLEYERRRETVNKQLQIYFKESGGNNELIESMRYSLLSGGKRLCAVMCLAFCSAAGGNEDDAIEAAGAVEVLYTYSLVHNDLACMKNEDVRNGKPSNHRLYGEGAAILTGDALLAEAFGILLNLKFSAETVVKMCRALTEAVGLDGYCSGQMTDIRREKKTAKQEELTVIRQMKESSFLTAAARIGTAAAGGSDEQAECAVLYAKAVGLAYQIHGDMRRETSALQEIHKPKTPYEALFTKTMSREKCLRIIREQVREAEAAVDGIFVDAQFLISFARMLEERNS